jgi:hypothetical protein
VAGAGALRAGAAVANLPARVIVTGSGTSWDGIYSLVSDSVGSFYRSLENSKDLLYSSGGTWTIGVGRTPGAAVAGYRAEGPGKGGPPRAGWSFVYDRSHEGRKDGSSWPGMRVFNPAALSTPLDQAEKEQWAETTTGNAVCHRNTGSEWIIVDDNKLCDGHEDCKKGQDEQGCIEPDAEPLLHVKEPGSVDGVLILKGNTYYMRAGGGAFLYRAVRHAAGWVLGVGPSVREAKAKYRSSVAEPSRRVPESGWREAADGSRLGRADGVDMASIMVSSILPFLVVSGTKSELDGAYNYSLSPDQGFVHVKDNVAGNRFMFSLEDGRWAIGNVTDKDKKTAVFRSDEGVSILDSPWRAVFNNSTECRTDSDKKPGVQVSVVPASISEDKLAAVQLLLLGDETYVDMEEGHLCQGLWAEVVFIRETGDTRLGDGRWDCQNGEDRFPGVRHPAVPPRPPAWLPAPPQLIPWLPPLADARPGEGLALLHQLPPLLHLPPRPALLPGGGRGGGARLLGGEDEGRC